MKPAKKVTIQGIQFEIGPDLDLVHEAVFLPDGTRLTEELAAQWSDRITAGERGRPSSTGEPKKPG